MIDLLKICLKEMELELLIQRLKTHLNPKSLHYNTIVLQSQRYTSIQKNLMNGVIKSDDNSTEKIKISVALHMLIDEIDESDFFKGDNIKSMNEEDIQEAVEFIQGKINNKKLSYSYKDETFESFYKFSSYKFRYLGGVGEFYFKTSYYDRELVSGLKVTNKYEIYIVEVPFKDLKSVEVRIMHIPSDSVKLSKLDIIEIIFRTRNHKQTIQYTTTETGNIKGRLYFKLPTENQTTKCSFKEEYILKIANKEDAERLVKAFQFLMKANGAKDEMF